MDAGFFFTTLATVIGGLGVFLLGMKHMSEGMQAVAGNRLRRMIGMATDNRILGCIVGTLVTCLVQSSSVTTVMVVGFVNGGFMTLMQAIGVIIGANIGTTITGWILVLKIGKYGLPILGVAALIYLFSRRDRLRYTALCFMGIGMVFFGLVIMGDAFKVPVVSAALKTVFAAMSATTYLGIFKCALVGCLATMIVQSSSATLGVTIALAQAGVIDFSTAAGLIVGLNIGTTITAFLASLGTTANAKRAAYAHIIFNVLGTFWLVPFFIPYTHAVQAVTGFVGRGDDITTQIALTHSGFNIINTLIFLPLMGYLAKFVTRLVPDKTGDQEHLTYLDVRMLESPAISIQQSYDELRRMGKRTLGMSAMVRELLPLSAPESASVRQVFHEEDVLDNVQKEVTVFLGNLMGGNITHELMAEARKQLRIADEFESIGDYYVTILKRRLKLAAEELDFTEEGLSEILALHDRVEGYLRMIGEALARGDEDILAKAKSGSSEITHLYKDTRDRHLGRVGDEGVSPLKSLFYTDILQSYRKIKDHALNIAEALAGVK